MAMRRLNIAGLNLGGRVVAANSFARAHKLQGTELLLTQAGRNSLVEHYKNAFSGGAHAVCTSLSTNVEFLDAANFYEDHTLENDISHYKVGSKATELQGRGFVHHVPRSMVSIGEKRLFAELLASLALEAAFAGRDAAGATSSSLVGANVFFTSTEDPHLGQRMVRQMHAVSTADFFAFDGCAGAADIEALSAVLEAEGLRNERARKVDLRGMDYLEEQPSPTGFDVPAIVRTQARPCTDEFMEALEAAVAAPRICGLCAPSVLTDAERDTLAPIVAQHAGFFVAGPSEAAGELAVHLVS